MASLDEKQYVAVKGDEVIGADSLRGIEHHVESRGGEWTVYEKSYRVRVVAQTIEVRPSTSTDPTNNVIQFPVKRELPL